MINSSNVIFSGLRDLYQKSQNIKSDSKSNLLLKNNYGLFDLSRNLIDADILKDICYLLEKECILHEIAKLSQTNLLNNTEGRAVGHFLLRDLFNPEKNVFNHEINESLQKMEGISKAIISKEYVGFSGKPIDTIVNIGIGGSHLGSELTYQALKDFSKNDLKCYFLASCDPDHYHRIISHINPETSLFLVSSKSFNSLETLTNYKKVRSFLESISGDSQKVAKQFIAITANPEKAQLHHFDSDRIIPFFDYVGGRFSVWSAVGFPLLLKIGPDNFKKFLYGAFKADQEFQQQKPMANLAIMLAVFDLWYANFLNISSRAIIPYTEKLKLLPDHLQQLHMESLGKSVNINGQEIDYEAGLAIWGGVGANSQHSFHQFFYQSKRVIPIDFIVAAKAGISFESDLQEILVAQCLGQAEALWQGVDEKELLASTAKGLEHIAPHLRTINRKPSNLLFLNHLDCETMGYLLATYENKVAAQAIMAKVNAYDQFGVELGKKVTTPILDYLQGQNGNIRGSKALLTQLEFYLKNRDENS